MEYDTFSERMNLIGWFIIVGLYLLNPKTASPKHVDSFVTFPQL